MNNNRNPLVQVSIDTQTISEGIRQAQIAAEAGADWIEVGTPLITYEGMSAIDALVKIKKPEQEILVDYKALDGVAQYFLETAKRGASIATVMAQATDFSIMKAVETGHSAGVEVMADMFCWSKNSYIQRALRMEELGVDYLLVHLSIDEFRHPKGSKNPLAGLLKLTSNVEISVGVVVFTLKEAQKAVSQGASFIVIGTPIIESANAAEQLTEFISQLKKG